MLHKLANQFSMCPQFINTRTQQTSTCVVYFSLAESQRVKVFLMEELVSSNAFKHPRFNLSSLACSPSCSESIKGFIQMVATNFPFSSEQEALERVIRLICQETTPEAIGIRRCIVLAYELIHSLRDDDQSPHHQYLGTQLMERGEPWV